MPATGIRNPADPIIIGNATFGFMPSKLTKIMHGANIPIPMVIRAPRMKFTAIAITSLIPETPVDSPPPGKSFICVMNIRLAATTKAIPIPI